VRILQAANFVAPHSGGIKTMLRHLAAGYAAAGHEVVQLVPGAVTRTVGTRYGRRIELAGPTVPATGGYRMITRWMAVENVLEVVRPDRVEVSDRFTLARIGGWARRTGVPSVIFSHERLDALLRFYLGRSVPSRRVADAWNRRLATSFDTVVCTTHWAAAEFVRLGVRQLARVPLGVDLETFNPDRRDAGRRTELAQGADVLLAAAVRLSPEKRPDLLVSALEELLRRGVHARLVVCGDGSVRDAMADRARGLPLTLAGHIPDPVVLATVLASADVVIAPGPYETFGLGALEAMACGTPVVACDSGALPELVAGVGFTAGVWPGAIAGGVERALAAGVPARRAAREHAERYSWSNTVVKMLQVHDLDTVHRVPFHSGVPTV
jgi:alpha-1,6-mannosyltransferase